MSGGAIPSMMQLLDGAPLWVQIVMLVASAAAASVLVYLVVFKWR